MNRKTKGNIIGCCMLLISVPVSADDLWTTSGYQTAGRVSASKSLQLDGPAVPDFPPPSTRLHNRILYVQGSQQDDMMYVWEWHETIVVYVDERPAVDLDWVVAEQHAFEDIDAIVMYGLAGDDVLQDYLGGRVPVFLFGGRGDDTLERFDAD